MTHPDWPQVKQILGDALEQDPRERDRFVASACGDNDELRARVQQLLAADRRAGGFLSSASADTPYCIADQERIGPYRLRHVLGEGGMGVVFLAEQDNPRREVALKIVKGGLSEQRRRRFELEASILGRLRHPGIAQIYEAGTHQTPRGAQPFFAMELIDGKPLTQYADGAHLNVRQRLALVAEIADAVEYAHQQGVIHRDLKPSNILVDESGRAHILDFGVARATDADITVTSLQTGMTPLIGTLAYMSPEQAAGDPEKLDTRSDVYSLGVLAYELLSGRLPHSFADKMLHEAVRIILEEEPDRLSSIDRLMRGDIEIIIGKALEKEKSRRYQSAAALAEDIRRFLHDQPIVARSPGTGYVLGKFVKRHRGLFAAAAVVLAVSVAGVVSTSRQERLRDQERTALLDRAMNSAESHILRRRELIDRLHTLRRANESSARHAWKNRNTADADSVSGSDLHAFQQLREEARLEGVMAERDLRDILREYVEHRAARNAFRDLQENIARELQLQAQLTRAEIYWRASLDYTQDSTAKLPRAALQLDTRPTGAVIQLFRYVVESDDLPWPKQAVLPGRDLKTPLSLADLPPGSYLIEIKRPGSTRIVRYPVLLARGESVKIPALEIPSDEDIGEGWEYIPPGPFLAGGDAGAESSEPLTTRFVDGFFMKTHEVTCAEYAQFLTALYQHGETCRYDKTSDFSGVEVLNGVPVHTPHDHKGLRFSFVESEARATVDLFSNEQAIHFLVQADANHYAQWLNEKARATGESWVYSLPTSDQWEKAARGVDGRLFTWSNEFRWHLSADFQSRETDTHMAPARFDMDRSPYGILDLVGNVREFCSDFDPATERYLVRGGDESSYEPDDFRLAARRGAIVGRREWDFGIRLVRTRVTRARASMDRK